MKIDIEKKVIKAAGEALYKQNYASFINVLLYIGWLKEDDVENWRRGRVPYLEKVICANLSKINRARRSFHKWGIDKGLKPSNTIYMSWGKRTKRKVRFSISGNPQIEESFSTHYLSPLVSGKRRGGRHVNCVS